jgi:hypothetical protein
MENKKRKGIDMKSQKTVRCMLLLSVSVLWIFTIQSYGQEKPKEAAGLTISRLVVGTGVEASEPVGAAETFPASTEKVYCFVEAAQIPKDMEISFVWSHNGKELLKTALPLKAGPRWRTYANKNLRGLKGEWKVEIKDPDGKTLKEVKFKVE